MVVGNQVLKVLSGKRFTPCAHARKSMVRAESASFNADEYDAVPAAIREVVGAPDGR